MITAIVLVTRHKEWHRRFVFVAALCLVAPAATRWTLRVLGKLHPATLTSIALLLPFHVSGAWIARSDWWNATASGLIGPP